VSDKKRKIKAFKQSLVTVFTGLIINFPLQFIILYLCLDVLGLSDPLIISIYSAAIMTVTAIVRCYIINIYFDKGEYHE